MPNGNTDDLDHPDESVDDYFPNIGNSGAVRDV